MELRFKHLPRRLYFFGLLAALATLPRKTAYKIARKLGHKLEESHPNTREKILQNLRLVLSKEKQMDIEKLARSYFEQVACEDLDAYYYPFWNRNNLANYFEISDLNHLDRALEHGRGAILLTGHIGTVCAGMVALGILGYPIRHVARDYMSDTTIEPMFRKFALIKLRWMESKMGFPLIYAHSGNNLNLAAAVLNIKRSLAKNQLVSMALDVNPLWVSDSVPVTFLEKKCRLTSSLVQLAHECQWPIIPYFSLRHPETFFRHRIEVRPQINLCGNLAHDVQSCVDELESVIRRYPSQWFSWDSLVHFENLMSK